MIDMFSGLGGASEAFLQNDWSVMRLDNNTLLEGVPYTTMVDITKVMLMDYEIVGGEIDLIWASPPCTEFSFAYGAPGPKAKREGKEFTPDLALALAAKEWVDLIKPRYWCVENVIGSIKYLTPIFGPPRQIIGPFVLYGNFPYLEIPEGWTHSKFTGDTWSTDPLRANRRAKVPYTISEALLRAILNQKTLEDFA